MMYLFNSTEWCYIKRTTDNVLQILLQASRWRVKTFPIIVTSLDSTDNKHGVQRQVRRCRRKRNLICYIEYFRKAAGILLLGVWCKNIRYNIPIITLVGVWPNGLSPLEKLGHPPASPRVTLFFSGRPTVGSHSNKGDNCIRSWKRQTKGAINQSESSILI
jgi:hypothetical protein